MGSPSGAEFKISTRVPGINPIVINLCLRFDSPTESILTIIPDLVSLNVKLISSLIQSCA